LRNIEIPNFIPNFKCSTNKEEKLYKFFQRFVLNPPRSFSFDNKKIGKWKSTMGKCAFNISKISITLFPHSELKKYMSTKKEKNIQHITFIFYKGRWNITGWSTDLNDFHFKYMNNTIDLKLLSLQSKISSVFTQQLMTLYSRHCQQNCYMWVGIDFKNRGQDKLCDYVHWDPDFDTFAITHKGIVRFAEPGSSSRTEADYPAEDFECNSVQLESLYDITDLSNVSLSNFSK
jgi:hypothetical protein